MEENNVVKKKKMGLKIFLGILLVLVIAAAGFVFYAVQQENMYDAKSKEAGNEYSTKEVLSENTKNDAMTAEIEKEMFKQFSKEESENLGDGLTMKTRFDKKTRSFIVKLEDNSEEKYLRYYLVDGKDIASNKEEVKEIQNDWNEMTKMLKDLTKVFNDVNIDKISVVVINPYNEKKELLRITDGKVIYDFHKDIEKNKKK